MLGVITAAWLLLVLLGLLLPVLETETETGVGVATVDGASLEGTLLPDEAFLYPVGNAGTAPARPVRASKGNIKIMTD
jgi:hypothetical protein